MCGIAFVLQHAQVRCSACGAALLSYQEECDHRRLVRDADDNNEKESRASNEVQGNGGVAREAAHNIGPSIEGLAQELQRRGPDGVRHLSIPLADVSNTEPGGAAKPKHPSLQFIGAELQLRGEEVVRQPLEDGHGNVLVFNGEIFGGLPVAPNQNDGQKLLEALQATCVCPPDDVATPTTGVIILSADASTPLKNVSSCASSGPETAASCSRCHRPTVVRILSELRGPWALAYWQAGNRTLWYGRDFVGRRSLVAHLPDELDGRFIVSSVAVRKRRSGGVVDNRPEFAGECQEVKDKVLKLSPRQVNDANVVEVSTAETNPTCSDFGTNGKNKKGQRHAKKDLNSIRFAIHEALGTEQNENKTESGEDVFGAGRGGPEEEVPFKVDVPAGVHSYGSENTTERNGNGTEQNENGAEQNGNGTESGEDVSGAGRSGPEEEALFDFWVDVPAGVYSYRPENGAHTRHAWGDPLVARLSRWRRERVEPPDDVGAGLADVSSGCALVSARVGSEVAVGRPELTEGNGREEFVDGNRRAELADRNGWAEPAKWRGQKDVAFGSAEKVRAVSIERTACSEGGEGGGVAEGGQGGGVAERGHRGRATMRGQEGGVAKRGEGGEVDKRGAEILGEGVEERWAERGMRGGAVERCQTREAAESSEGREIVKTHDEFEGAVERLLEALSRAVAKRVTGIRKRDGFSTSDTGGVSGESRSGLSNGFGHRLSSGLNKLAVQGNDASGDRLSDEIPNSASDAKPALSLQSADVSSGLPGRSADVAVLFSGGLDSMVLAALAGRHVTEGATIDLINVCFDGGGSPDRLSALAGCEELKTLFPDRRWRLIQVDSSLAEVDSHRPRLLSLICPSQTYMDLNIGAALWLAARGRGFVAVKTLSSRNRSNGSDDQSDGPECAAAEAPSSSGQHRSQTSNGSGDQSDGSVRAGILSSDGQGRPLQGAKPSNGSELREGGRLNGANSRNSDGYSGKDERQSNGQGHSGDRRSDGPQCIQARQSSRSRGRGKQRSDSEDGCSTGRLVASHRAAQVPYTSSACVLLVGSGADEQCAGYGRHRTKFREGGWQRLDAEMRLDVLRLWQRNLGRDDRCIADHGKEARFPFLDEDVMSLLLSLPLWIVADLREPSGVGDKRLLRAVARRLGITAAAALPKRAIQFGSRIARASNRRDFGSNRAANASAAGGASFRKDRCADPS